MWCAALCRRFGWTMKKTVPYAWCLLVVLGVLCGCANPLYHREPKRRAASTSEPVLRPVVAVTDFENSANFGGQWNLGGGMAEMMIERLMSADEVTVLERKHINGVVGEIVQQGRDLFRREGRVERGRLMNARYLVRGVVTDFTVTGDASGWFGAPGARARTRRSRARVGLYVTVSDVETGEIVSAVRTEGSATSGGLRAAVDYRDFTFGGDAFFRTPLGRATQTAMNRAVRRVLRDIPRERWEPRVAEGGHDRVVVNGGENVGLRVGQRFVVREEGRRITDPITGDVLERVPGRAIGELEIRVVHPVSAHAVLLEGKARRGDFLQAAY